MVKCASQLVQGEQIGWFTYGMVIKSPRRIIFSKQTAHLRRLLLSFFNGGSMLKPLDFVTAPAMQSTMWGIAAPQPHEVTLPEILHCRFQRGSDGAEMILWINTAAHRASGGTDAAAIQLTRGGVATALISIPNRYMHSPVEICDLRDVDGAVKILTETIAALTGNEQFRPGLD